MVPTTLVRVNRIAVTQANAKGNRKTGSAFFLTRPFEVAAERETHKPGNISHRLRIRRNAITDSSLFINIAKSDVLQSKLYIL